MMKFPTLSLAQDDIVIIYVGVGRDATWLNGVLDRCEQAVVRAVLTTGLPVFRSDVPDVAYASAADLIVREIARKRRLHVLDLFGYAMPFADVVIRTSDLI